MPLLLTAAFFITAILYASVGFGGGSTYNALLMLSGADYRVVPAIALICNVIVVTGGVWRFSQTGDLAARRLLPFLIASVPAAWIGGRLPINETTFIGLLGGALLISGLHLVVQRGTARSERASQPVPTSPLLAATIGGSIGILSGLVGIGGGIFLAPVLYFLRWGTAKQIAAASSLFILVNSVSGLVGQALKLQDLAILSLTLPYWPLPIAVLVGGQVGSWLAGYHIKPNIIRVMTAILILYVAFQLLYRWSTMI
ncbi:MAG: sulfite exporter TauE/SafE family protein [Hyphomonas sp.]|nr:sulfite exporter TauE/SafE family protein [Hyphomonas sp.]